MALILNRTESLIDREERNKINENWAMIEGSYKGIVDVVAKQAFNEIIDSAKLDWLSPVDTFSDLSSTYPNAGEGSTVMVRDTGKVYRNDGTNWVEIQEIDATAINEVDKRLSGEITEKAAEALKNATPRKHIFGGQLEKLKNVLSNPLQQIVGIVFIGDSISWGRTLPNNGPFDPRDGTLSDPRDIFATQSFVNQFKRYIGKFYANGAEPVLSNWYASPSGESIAEYTTQYILYPKDGDFTAESVGTSVTIDEQQVATSLTGFQLRLNDGNVSGTSYNSIKFMFTGDSFTLSLGCLEADATYYDLYVDGVLQGTYSTHAGIDGFVDGTSDNRRTHSFPYIRDKMVEIRSNRNGENTGNRRLRLEAIIINKKIRISNQGINGATARSYTLYNLSGNSSGDGEAVGKEDNFVFVQLATNDRLQRASVPKGSNTFKVDYKKLLDKVSPLANVILMCANPATEGETYTFTMQEARNVIYRTAKENAFDMIDNYIIFEGIKMTEVTADGVHPNEVGHTIIARNIINSIES